ncbi:hypothetical protein WJX81_005433 [Elliptochloris bilobata]|uniref:HTH myb-type domain-containing protein n=1 Tax=Elliptochloris bilobata TaxID=381761 RepID=A0AAW1RNA8_9CHLO
MRVHADACCVSPEECSAFRGGPRAALAGEKRPRLRWNPQLHALFVSAVTSLGGPDKAQPRTIQQAMRVEGLTLFHVKSHLQKYRRSLRADADALDASGEPHKRSAGAAQLVLQKQLEAHMEVRLEEAHALGAHGGCGAAEAALAATHSCSSGSHDLLVNVWPWM